MNLAALDRRVGAKGATDDFAQRFGAVDDEQPADLGIKPALKQVVDERPARRSSRKARSTRALLILFGTPTLRRPDGFGLATVRPL